MCFALDASNEDGREPADIGSARALAFTLVIGDPRAGGRRLIRYSGA